MQNYALAYSAAVAPAGASVFMVMSPPEVLDCIGTLLVAGLTKQSPTWKLQKGVDKPKELRGTNACRGLVGGHARTTCPILSFG